LNLDKPEEGLLPHSPDFWTLCSLPYDFDIGATCPRFEEALALWQPSEEAQLLMQAWAGYCLLPGNPEQVFLLNQGEGGDGKSQWATVLRALLGERNVQGVGLEAFDPKNRFGLEPLLGAVMNIVGDANDIEKMGEGVLKAIVGGDPITIDRKHKSAITERLQCKFMMNCNTLPPFRDRTEGLWRRIILLLWEQAIPKEKRIKDFGEVIVQAEVQGIFNWALCGYHRVKKEGFNVDPMGRVQRGISEARGTIQKEREFFEDCLGWDPDPNTNVSLTLPALVHAYQDWCRAHNNKANLYGQNLAKCMLSWLKDTYPAHREKFVTGTGSIKQRKLCKDDDESSKRQWTYVGVFLRPEGSVLGE
jgi:putative DNA primase/helicase